MLRGIREVPTKASSTKPVQPEREEVSVATLTAPDAYTGALHALLTHLQEVGFEGAPKSYGWDDRGRHLVEFIAGIRADHTNAPLDALQPARIGAFMREMHDALANFTPPADAVWFTGLPNSGEELIIHQDIAPSNLVWTDDGRLVAIDWDAAAPGTRMWDVAYAVHTCVPISPRAGSAEDAAFGLRKFVNGYSMSDEDRDTLVEVLSARSERMYEYLDTQRLSGQSPWVELWDRGVGIVWKRDAMWIREHEPVWRDALLG